jgi:sugar lactone lactonase YvrE
VTANRSENARDVRVLAQGLSFLEGPRWRDGRLYVSDFYTHRVLSFEESDGMRELCVVPGQPSGLGFSPEGRLLVVSMLDRRLLRLEGSELVAVADLSNLAGGPCNDMVVDRAGRAYVGNFGWDANPDAPIRATVLIRVEPDGSAAVAADELVFPNGTVISPNGKTLLVAETFASRISAFDLAGDGSLTNRRVWASFGPGSVGGTVASAVASGLPLPDGLAHDAEGAVWMGDAAGSGALRVATGGEILDSVPTGELAVFAVALGGDDRRTLYMCASPPLLQNDPSVDHRAQLLACRVDVPGAGLP